MLCGERNGVRKQRTRLWLACVVVNLVDLGIVGGSLGLGRVRHACRADLRGGRDGADGGEEGKTRQARVLTKEMGCRNSRVQNAQKRALLYLISQRTSRRNHHRRILALYVIYVSLSILKKVCQPLLSLTLTTARGTSRPVTKKRTEVPLAVLASWTGRRWGGNIERGRGRRGRGIRRGYSVRTGTCMRIRLMRANGQSKNQITPAHMKSLWALW